MAKTKKIQKRIYLDYAATTPLDKKVSKRMQETADKFWGNPSSLHSEGERARENLGQSRSEIAEMLNCRSGEIYFTSGGTEAANIAILGVITQAKERGITAHVIVSSIEHPAILEPVKSLIKWGVEVSYVNPDENGIINPESIKREIKENTVLISVMHANNEIGTLQPVHKIGNLVREYRKNKTLNRKEPLLAYPYFLVDASQSALYENIALERLNADILILDGIKIYGPRGAGILAVKTGVGISPVTFGGGQEKNLRPGTENVVNAAGLAEALKIANSMREKESARLAKLRDYAIEKILREIRGTTLNGHAKERLPNNINICFSHTEDDPWDSEFLVIKLDTLGFAVSSASACSTLKTENSSYVIKSLGRPECAASSLRFTLGRGSTKSDLDKLISALKTILRK